MTDSQETKETTVAVSGAKILIYATFLITCITSAFTLLNSSSTLFVLLGILIIVACGVISLKVVPPEARKIAKALFPVLLIGILGMGSMGCMTRVGPGYAGVKVNLAGDNRGVDAIPFVTGWVFYNPFFTSVYKWPIYVQTGVWSREDTRESPGNEEVSFNSKEGMIITGDISLSYRIRPEAIPAFYVKFRSSDIFQFTHGYMKNVARDLFNEVAGKYSVEEIYGPKKEEFLAEVRKRLEFALTDIGIVLEQFGFIGAPRPPDPVVEALNAKVAATQKAMQRENELRQAQAEAQKRIAAAEGEAESNRILTASISAPLLEWRRLEILERSIDKWDGRRPMVEGQSSGMLLELPMSKILENN